MNLKLSKRIKAFTVLELIISMVLSLFVVLIAVLAFEMISKQYIHYKKNNDVIGNFYMLEGLLTNDFEFCQKVEWDNNNNNSIIFTMPSNKIYTYQLQDTSIIRLSDLSSDTFCLKINQIDKNFPDPDNNNKIIDELKLGFSILNEDFTLFLRKEYGALCFVYEK